MSHAEIVFTDGVVVVGSKLADDNIDEHLEVVGLEERGGGIVHEHSLEDE